MTIRTVGAAGARVPSAPQAAKSADTKGRLAPSRRGSDSPGAFQRDRDRVIHCKAFRRLKHKTQVFFAPTGESSPDAAPDAHAPGLADRAQHRAKVLRLNEELTEAIALGHDLGHTPFGHAGERVLQSLVPAASTITSRASASSTCSRMTARD